MKIEHTIIIGAGPCGLSCAIELQRQGVKPLIIEKAGIVQTIYRFPTHQTFFSTSNKLEIGGIPFVTANWKPVRKEALAYYREVAKREELRIHTFETVNDVQKENDIFIVRTVTESGEDKYYKAKHIVVATGYYDQPKTLDVPGEDLPKVMHYFKEAHPYYKKDVVIIGGRNSAVDTALELYKANANITVLYRGKQYSPSIKPWVLPDFDSLVNKDRIKMIFQAEVTKITNNYVYYEVAGKEKVIKNDFVFAMTGYQPNIAFMKKIGIKIDEDTGKPHFNEQTYETNVNGIYVAGVVISGFDGNETFIENGRFHGEKIAQSIINS